MPQTINNIFLNKTPFKGYSGSLLKKYQQITHVEFLPGLYSDSSSQIWLLQFSNEFNKSGFSECVLKSCDDNQAVLSTPFWEAMNLLFGLSLKKAYQNASYSYPLISSLCQLKIPTAIDLLVGQNQAALAVEKISGSPLSSSQLSMKNIEQLSDLLIGLHQYSVSGFGRIESPKISTTSFYDSNVWRQKVTEAIEVLSQKKSIESVYIDQAIELVKQIEFSKNVPLMMDLRWDQFAQNNGDITGVFDLDAYVFAPAELDFVMLEYLLTAQQADVFKKRYFLATNCQVIISKEQRVVYRVLFYLMNALGEKDIDRWMARPVLFTG